MKMLIMEWNSQQLTSDLFVLFKELCYFKQVKEMTVIVAYANVFIGEVTSSPDSLNQKEEKVTSYQTTFFIFTFITADKELCFT